MAITTADLKWFYASNRDKTTPSRNGGRPTGIQISNNVEGNIWPSVTSAQRKSGVVQAEKVFAKNTNANNESGMNPWMALSIPNKTDEYEYVVMADQDGFQSDLTGNERRYTASALAEAVQIGATQVKITLDEPSLVDCYQVGDDIVIYNSGLSLANTSCVYEFAKISNVSASGTTVTLQLDGPGLEHAFALNNGIVTGIIKFPYEFGARVDNIVQSGTGQYDFDDSPLELDNIGTIRQNWTITYNGDGTVDVTGDDQGSLGDFPTINDIAPVNTQFSKPYFTLAARGHGQSHVAGDTIKFNTYASVLPLWWFKVVPQNCGSIPMTSSKIVAMTETG